jgi:hypothetical protein
MIGIQISESLPRIEESLVYFGAILVLNVYISFGFWFYQWNSRNFLQVQPIHFITEKPKISVSFSFHFNTHIGY